MKISYLIGAVTFTVLILIIAFQNITVRSSFVLFFSIENTSMTLPILFLSVVGMIAGALYTLFLKSIISEKEDQREENSDVEF